MFKLVTFIDYYRVYESERQYNQIMCTSPGYCSYLFTGMYKFSKSVF